MAEVIYESAAETAKKIRVALREAFPDLPARHFSVKSSSYAGGSSVSVRWDDYPGTKEVNRVAKKFESAGFDGMQDMKTYHPYEFEGKRYSGADYVMCQREVSSGRREKADELAAVIWGEDEDRNSWDWNRKVMDVEEDLDKDLNYVGKSTIPGLVQGSDDAESGHTESSVRELMVNEFNRVEQIIGRREDTTTKDWEQSRLDALTSKFNSDANINYAATEYFNMGVEYAVAEEIVSTVKDAVEDEVIATFIDEYEQVVRDINGENVMEDAVRREYENKFMAGSAKSGLIITMIREVAIGAERQWYTNLVLDFILDNRNGFDNAVQDMETRLRSRDYVLVRSWNIERINEVIQELMKPETKDVILERANSSNVSYVDAVNVVTVDIINKYEGRQKVTVERVIEDELTLHVALHGGTQVALNQIMNGDKFTEIFRTYLTTYKGTAEKVVRDEVNKYLKVRYKPGQGGSNVELEVGKYVTKLESYGIEDVRNWHDSRIQRVVARFKSSGVQEEIKVAVQNGTAVEEAVETAGNVVVGLEHKHGLEKFHEIIDASVSSVLDDMELSEDAYEDLKDGIEVKLFSEEKSTELDKQVFSIAYGKEAEWFKREVRGAVVTLLNEGRGGIVASEDIENEVVEPERLTVEDRDEINTIVKGVYGWLATNGFTVNKKGVKDGIKEAELLAIKNQTAGTTGDERLLQYEGYIFKVSEGNLQSVKLTEDDKEKVNTALKRLLGLKANGGEQVDTVELKKEFDLVKLAKMKKIKGQDGDFLAEVNVYLTGLCDTHTVRKVAGNTGVAPDAVVVNGVDIKEVITALVDGLVTLTFEKADGTIRTMIGTRNTKFVSNVDSINTEAEINKQIGTGRIPVWDMQKNEMRAFVMSRLKTYTVNGETIEVGASQAADAVNQDVHFDPSALTIDQMLKVLSKSVVRVTFKKKDGTARVMWGTRDASIIELYQPAGNPMLKSKGEDLTEFDSEQKRQAQIDGDYVRVFDLTVNEFRTFKPSTLLRMDEAQNVGSWIEFKPKQDGWYNCIYSGTAIGKYYEEGKRKAIDSPERENSDRNNKERILAREVEEVEYTREAIQRQKEQALEGKDERQQRLEERKARWAVANVKVKAALATVGEYTEQDNETYTKMKTMVEKLQDKFIDLQRDGKGRGEIKDVKLLSKSRIITFGYEDDKYILHPRFIINGISHKVFADRTGVVEFEENARRSSGDAELTKELDTLAVMVTGRRVRNVLDVTLVEDDIRRLRRVMALVTIRKDALRQEKITISAQAAVDGAPPHLLVTVDGKKFVMSPAIIFSIDRRESIYKRERHTATLAEFRDAVVSHELLGIEPDAFRLLVSTLTEAYDLRKRVQNEQGIAV